MKILYIKRQFSNRTFVSRIMRNIRRYFFFYEIEGFFEASIYNAFNDITEMKLDTALQCMEKVARDYDVVVINKQSAAGAFEKLIQVGRTKVKTILFDPDDLATNIPPNNVCAAYDLIFKREHLKDLDRYNISDQNKAKLRPTMLPCLYVPMPRRRLSPLFKNFFIPQAQVEKKKEKYDVFFCGYITPGSMSRIEPIKAMKENLDIKFYGGLQPKPTDIKIQDNLLIPRMSSKEYAEATMKSRIILALDGWGEFTFRHLEAWYFGKFLLSSPSIRYLELPLPAKEGVHYIAFDDIDDLSSKVEYYATHDAEREKIAEAGKKMFEEHYGIEKHGKYIKDQIECIL